VSKWSVFRSLSPSSFCDLVVIKDDKVLKIEVRTGYRNRDTGVLSFPKTKHGDIDYFVVRDRTTYEIFYVNANDFSIVENI